MSGDRSLSAQITVIELRRYTLHPGRREDLIELFEHELVEPQEAAGMSVIGQFRDLDHPNTFTWLRGFPDMATRRRALEAFYGGPVWAVHRDAANATMIDSDDVHLVRPCSSGGSDSPSIPRREPRSDRRPPGRPRRYSIVVSRLNPTADADERARAHGVLVAPGWTRVLVMETLSAVNDFPKLPVHDDADVVVTVLATDDPAADDIVGTAITAAGGGTIRETSVFRLVPTDGSLLR